MTCGPVSLTKTIKSYLYVQYNDDDNLQGFVAAYNQMAHVLRSSTETRALTRGVGDPVGKV
jgi:hypothetical protein